MTDRTLQNINISIRLAANTLRKGPFCPPNRQKIVDQKWRLECPYAKTTLLRPPLLFDGRQLFIKDVKGQKSIFSEKSRKSRKKSQKSRFFENFWLLWLPTSLRAITLLPALDRTAQQNSWKNFKKVQAGMTFLKKSVFDPPPPNRQSLLTSIFGRWDSIDLSFSHHFGTACKVSSKVTIKFPRS